MSMRNGTTTRHFIFRRTASDGLFALFVIGTWLFSVRASGTERVTKEEGLAAFETVRVVLQHPRCQNCHIPGDAPLQFDDGRVHAQNVMRGSRGTGVPGLPCATCHGMANAPASWGAHMPPGTPNWHLPAPDHKMVFIGLSSGELCRHLKEKSSTGGRDLEALLRHITADRIVLWGWNPGVGRNPVSVPHDEFVAKFKQWMAAGAPCAAD